MKLIHELAFGNLQPMVRNFKKDTVYAKLLSEVAERQDKLIATGLFTYFVLDKIGL